MKNICFIIALFVCSIAKAQILVVKTALGSCPKCQIPISLLQPNNTGIPSYILFPSESKASANDIEEMYEFKKRGFRMIFSDEIIKYLNADNSSTIYLLASNGKVIWKKPLSDVQVKDIQSGIRLYAAHSLYYDPNTRCDIMNDHQYIYSYQFGKVKRISGIGDTINYRFTVDEADELRKKSGSDKYNDNNALLGAMKILGPQFKPVLTGYNLVDLPQTLLSCRYYNTVVRGDDTILGQAMGILKYSNNKKTGIYPVISPEYNLDLSYANSCFLAPDESTFYTVCNKNGKYDATVKDADKFIGVFKLKKDKYVFDHLLDIQLSPTHTKYFGYNMVDLYCSDFPYFTLSTGTDIYDIRKQQVHTGFFPEKPDYSKITMDKINKSGKDALPFYNECLAYDDVKNRIYIVTQVNKKRYLQIISTNTWKLVALIPLEQFIPNADASQYVAIDSKYNSIYCANAQNVIIGYPLLLAEYN